MFRLVKLVAILFLLYVAYEFGTTRLEEASDALRSFFWWMFQAP